MFKSVVVAVISQSTRLEPAPMSKPRGKAQIAPTPASVLQLIRRLKFAGTPGAVPHAVATDVSDAAAEASESAIKDVVLVGFTPTELGLPSP